MINVACSLEMCRCCGNIADLNELIQINFAAKVKQELIQCWKIEITDMDGLPQHICGPCHAKFDDYLNFRKKCIEEQDKLKTLYQNFKSMMGRISIKKKCDIENRTEDDKDSGINKINTGNTEKFINATQNQKKSHEKIVSKIINVSNVHKGVIATQKQNQSIQEVANKTYVATTIKSENTMQKQIQIQSSQGIVSRIVINETSEDSIQKVQNTSEKQNQIEASKGIFNKFVITTQNQIRSSPGIVSKLEINEANIDSTKEIKNTPQKPNQIQSSRGTARRLIKTNEYNEEKNLKTMQKQNRNRIYNSSTKKGVEFVVFPDITYSKATISKTYMQDIIERRTDITNTDPLDNLDIDVINTESVQQHAKNYCTLFNDMEIDTINTESAQQRTKDCTPIEDTEIDIFNTESVQHAKDCTIIEEKTENNSYLKETITDVDSFVDETTQSTTASDRLSFESDKPEISETTEEFDNRLIKETENSLDETVPLKCKYCISDVNDPFLHNENFPTKAKLIRHITLIHDPKLPYICLFCITRKFRTSQICIYHIMHAHKQNRDICQACGIGRGSFKRFIEHFERFHSYGDYECEICGKQFENVPLSRFEYHKRWHNRNRQMQCTYCARIFVQLPHLQAHEMIHTKNYKIKCEICDAGFRTQYRKAVHVSEIHGGEKPIKCSFCDKRFNHYSQRDTHMEKIHNHVKNRVDEKFQCLRCKKMFRREAGYRRHLETNCLGKKKQNQTNNYNNIYKFPCGQCSYRFKTEPGLKQHLILHSTEGRPFECNICHLNFKTSSNLDSHRKLRHSSNKPFECDVCGKCFVFKYILNGHRKFHK